MITNFISEEASPEIKKVNQIYKNAKNNLKKVITKEQEKCNHEWKKKFEEENFFSSKRILKKIFCPKCLAVKLKPNGFDYQICKYCWTEMKSMGTYWIGQDRYHGYKCPQCGHEEEHT